MLRRASLILLLLPGVALAQTSTGTVTALVTTQGTSGQANRVECASTTSMSTWTVVASGITIGTGDRWRLATAATATGCQTSGGLPSGIGSDIAATNTTQAISLVPVSTMATMGGVSSCTQAGDVQVNLCVYYLAGGSTTNWSLAALGTFTFQMAVPPAPVVSGVTPGDTQLSVSVTPGTKTATETADTGVTYTVTCTPPTGGGTPSVGGPGNAGGITCGSLTNGTAYVVAATGQSAAGNPGPVSASVGPDASTTPQAFLNFWEIYKGADGVETGGCGSGGAGAVAPVLALAGLLAIRRRRS